jgi:hypothetical protein
MSTQEEPRQPSEEEIRAAYEAQIKKVRIDHLLLEDVVTLANLGLRRTGLAPGTEDERDPQQVRLAIDSIRALLPLLEQSAPEHVGQIRDALSQLQLAFVKIGGEKAGEEDAEAPTSGAGPSAERPEERPEPQPKSEGPGPAQRSGRLWVPGQ